MTESSFSECMKMLTENDMRGLEQIYDEYGKMIYSAVYQICLNSHTAEDITSEFFLRLKKAAHVYKENRGHKKWLMISARNLAVDFMRKASHESLSSQISDEENDIMDSIPDRTDTEENISGKMTADEMLGVLDAERREIVNMKVYCGLTLSEISAVMKIPLGTVAWKYRTAIAAMKKNIGKESYNG